VFGEYLGLGQPGFPHTLLAEQRPLRAERLAKNVELPRTQGQMAVAVERQIPAGPAEVAVRIILAFVHALPPSSPSTLENTASPGMPRWIERMIASFDALSIRLG